jgi:DMSO/TMAO reductase YedYZ heme-binding membrane subunit
MRPWKKLQRWNYAAFALLAVHALAYEKGIENQKPAWFATTIAGLAITLVIQLAGVVQRRRAEAVRA